MKIIKSNTFVHKLNTFTFIHKLNTFIHKLNTFTHINGIDGFKLLHHIKKFHSL
jgi:hypothetical protein